MVDFSRWAAAAAVSAALFLPSPVQTQVLPSAPRIQEIRVEGNQRVEPETVRSYMTSVRTGDGFEPERLDRALKDLFGTGLFADVTLRREGGALVVSVVENPIINRIAFEGNQRITEEVLRQEVQLRPRVVYTRTRVQSDVNRILDIYRRSGRFAASVEPKAIQLTQNRVDLVFEVDEGPRTNVRRINFVGNRQFSDSRLHEVVLTKESRWYRFFSSDDTYDPDRLSNDRELLRRHYLANGYTDFRVVSAVAELTPERDAFFVTFTIDEGERYRFGKVDLESRLRDLDPMQLRSNVTTTAGDWYNADAVESTINKLTDALGTLGYAFVEIRPRIGRNRDARTIDLTFEIEEGPRVYVDRINIVGNVRTMDKVVRREFRIAEGDAFNTAKLRRSRQRLRNLGFFEKVDVANVQGSAPDRTTINVEVEERSTGELSFGFGFSTNEGPLADISIRERNLLGRGQDLRLGLQASGRRQQVDLSFTEPLFLDRNLSAGFDLFTVERNRQRESSFDSSETGATVRLGYEITEALRQTLRYTLRQDEIANVPATASRFVREQQGSRVSSILGQELTYDRRDDRFDPTEGYFVRMGNEVAGLGGEVYYLRHRLSGAYYYALATEWVASVSGEAGYIIGLGENVRIQNRFFLGGDTFRGFANAGIGPRDIGTDDALGGNEYVVGTVELTFPTGLPKELGLKGGLFTDVGTLGSLDSVNLGVSDAQSLRASAGVGLSWRSPVGLIRISMAKAVLKEDYDKSELFRFSLGTRF
ncbi:MAG: outer membrane protein assembly factor BamA [Rhodospirillaceae bacterium]|nr:outer membrane protein assembly factor BamA [Rhodospirillaceae bacterium]